MMRLRNFRTDVADFDLKAKTRKIEKLAIAILDKTEKEPELAYKTSKLTNVYLPTLCRTMENYLEVKPIFCVYGLRIGIYKTKDKQIVFYFGGSSIGQMVFTKIKGKHVTVGLYFPLIRERV